MTTKVDFKMIKDVNIFGVNQTWQIAEKTNTGALFADGTPSYRAYGQTYVNTTDRPIVVWVIISDAGSANFITFTIDGVSTYGANAVVGDDEQYVIPPGSTYSATSDVTLINWLEFR